VTRIVVLFNLKPGVDRLDYENWAKHTDLPTVNGLSSVDGFSAHRAMALLGSDDPPPYQYVEILDVADMDAFGEDIAGDTMQKVAAEFQALADNPLFILTKPLGG